jgi:superfamily I DNA/RNA helicase
MRLNRVTDFVPTPEQAAILGAVRGSKTNLMIRARAGCGKTSTLELIDSFGTVPYLLICFNKTIATEASRRMRPATTVRTFNSIGHRIWADFRGKKLKLAPQKILEIYRGIVDDADRSERKHLWTLYDGVKNAVDMARAVGYIPADHAKASKRLVDFASVERRLDETLLAEAHGLVDRILLESIRLAYDGTIDFNDQVYMPALFGGLFPTFPVVLIDEYQDLSPVNRALAAKLCKHSRQIGVGDEAQAIYEFRGADADAMPRAIEEFSMAVLPLSTSFRCPSAITANVHWHVNDIRSSREGGIVETLSSFSNLQGESAVICRYNAPLLSLAMTLLGEGHKVDVAGVDIGSRVIKLLTKLGPDSLTQVATLSAIADWQAERESLDSKSAADTAECLRVFARHGRTLAQAIAYAEHIFKSTDGEIRFMSGHRSKGLEFDHVYHLDSGRIKPGGQEPNIHYVIDTRPKERLTYISSR